METCAKGKNLGEKHGYPPIDDYRASFMFSNYFGPIQNGWQHDASGDKYRKDGDEVNVAIVFWGQG